MPDARAHRIVVAAFSAPSHETMRCISECMPADGSVTVICPEVVNMPEGPFHKRFIRGHPGTAALLQQAGLDNADSVLLSGMQDWADTEADIQVCIPTVLCYTGTSCAPLDLHDCKHQIIFMIANIRSQTIACTWLSWTLSKFLHRALYFPNLKACNVHEN